MYNVKKWKICYAEKSLPWKGEGLQISWRSNSTLEYAHPNTSCTSKFSSELRPTLE
jgi:hypothetical protein